MPRHESPITSNARPVAATRWLAAAGSAAAGTALLAVAINRGATARFDRRVRAVVQPSLPPRTRMVLAPLFALGLPGGYITMAYATAWWLRRGRRRGGPAIVTAAWMGWLVHRGVKLVYQRERPRLPGIRRRTDSYPSGHTTGMTSLAITTAYVLRRRGVLSAGGAALLAAGAPLAMGAYRIIDDEHWASDVAGGLLLGGAIAGTCIALLADAPSPVSRRRAPRRRVRAARV